MLSSPVEEIKSRLDLIDTISEYFPLKQAGANFRALCPFHKEKSGSFMASKEKQIWHCFGCGEGGDIFGFVMKIEGLDFPDTLRLLATKAGVKLQKQDPKVIGTRNKLYDVTELSAKFFHELLLKHPKAEIARAYIKKRGLKPETVNSWRLGYSPDSWDVLNKFLKSRGFNDQEIFAAGMTVKKDRESGFYDRFRNRLMFPINDVHGNVVGFTARVLDETKDKMGKYINSPQSGIYDKGRLLFGLDRAKQDIRKQNLAVLVEGNMDCISSHEAGVTNVVASSGTALTQDQTVLLKRFSENVALSFDADAAGENAALRGIDIALQQGMNIKVVTIPEGKDPDDCIRHNPADWSTAIKNAQSIMDYYFTRALNGLDLSSAQAKKNAAKFLLTQMAKMPDQIEQSHYIQKLSSAINVSESILRSSLPSKTAAKPVAKPEQKIASGDIDRHKMLSERLIALVLANKDLKTFGDIKIEMVTGELPMGLYKELQNYYNQTTNSSLDESSFWQNWPQKLTDPKLKNYHDQLGLYLDNELDPGTNLAKELAVTILEMKKLLVFRRAEAIAQDLKRAESSKDQEKIALLSKQSNEISKELNSLRV